MFDFERQWWGNKFKEWFGKKEEGGNTKPMSDETNNIPDNTDSVQPTPKPSYINFMPTKVIPDEVFGYGTGDDLNITNFLRGNGSFLADYEFDNKSVEEIIKQHCKHYNVNPKWILTSLQREQGLVSKKSVDELKSYTKKLRTKGADGKYVTNADGSYVTQDVMIYPLDWCLGFGVPDFDMPMEKFKGFENQISNAARRSRELFDQGAKMLGKDFETLDFTIVTDKIKDQYATHPSDGDDVKKWKENQLAYLLKKAQNYDLLRLKYDLTTSDKPEKNLMVNLGSQWAYLLYMYTPHVEAAQLTHTLWLRYWAFDLTLA